MRVFPKSIGHSRRAIIASVILAITAACAESLSPSELLLRAQSAMDNGDYAAAEIDIKAALQELPNDALGRLMNADLALWRHQHNVAQEEIERSLAAGSSAEALELYAEILVLGNKLTDFDALLAEGAFSPIKDNARFKAFLAKAQLEWGEAEQSKQNITEALEADGTDYDVRLLGVELAAARGGQSFAEISESVLAIAQEYPQAHSAWGYVANLRFIEQDYEGTKEATRKSLAINPFRFDDRLLLASALLRLGEYDKAEKVLAAAARIAPESPRLQYTQAQLLAIRGDFEQALQSINSVLAVAGNSPDALRLAASINSAEGNLETARRQYTAYLEAKPSDYDATLKLAQIQIALGELDAAEQMTEQLLEADPMNVNAKRVMAAVLALLGQHAQSAETLSDVLALQPDSPDILVAHSSALARSGSTEAALEQLNKAKELDPGSANVRARLVAILISAKDFEAAKQEADSFVAEHPDDPRAHGILGRVLQLSGDMPNARTSYEEALLLAPADRVANFGIAEIALRAGNADEAIGRLEAILAKDPGNLQALSKLAGIYATQGNADSAADTLRKAIDTNPRALDPRLMLASYYLSQQQAPDALQLMNDYLESSPEEPRAHALVAKAYLSMGEYRSAYAAAQRVTKFEPTSAMGQSLTADIAVVEGNLNKVESALSDAVAISDSGDLRLRLAEAQLKNGHAQEAMQTLQEASQGSIGVAQMANAQGAIEAARGNMQAALTQFEIGHENAPSTASALKVAESYWRLDMRDAAIEFLNVWNTEHSEDMTAKMQLATYFTLTGDNRSAMQHLKELNIAKPGIASILNNLAWASKDIEPKRSLSWSSEALELAPESTEVLDTHAMVLLANGRTEKAEEVMQKLVTENPNRGDFAEHLEDIRKVAGNN